MKVKWFLSGESFLQGTINILVSIISVGPMAGLRSL